MRFSNPMHLFSLILTLFFGVEPSEIMNKSVKSASVGTPLHNDWALNAQQFVGRNLMTFRTFRLAHEEMFVVSDALSNCSSSVLVDLQFPTPNTSRDTVVRLLQH